MVFFCVPLRPSWLIPSLLDLKEFYEFPGFVLYSLLNQAALKESMSTDLRVALLAAAYH